ncbi:amidohydrolase family protein [Agaribacter flavus]|uniref:Amidohydrolase family protein n=1 Tax=Agaribacter flavus TaxID=1902781 RepID=A0ABV7FVI8_9ALTE
MNFSTSTTTIKHALLALALLLLALTQRAYGKPIYTGHEFVVTNVNIIDVKNKLVIPHQNIHVRNRKIIAISDYNPKHLPLDIALIEGRNGYITPGLIDMHVHMYEPAAFTIALSHGVTHVRIMNGVPAHLEWREALIDGRMIGSTVTVSSPIVSGYDDAPLHRTVHTADQAREAANEFAEAGYDLIKVYGNLNQEALNALVDEAHKLGMPLGKHGPHASGDMPISTLAGFQSFEHAEDIYQGPLNYQRDEALLPPIIDDLKATGVPITPTLNIFNQLTMISAQKQAYLDSLPEEYTSSIIALEAKRNQVARWLKASEAMVKHNQTTLAFLLTITQKLHEAAIPLLVGSDSGVLLSPHGLATHKEMQLLEKAGLSRFEVLEAATVNPAKALGMDRHIGQVTEGYNADFIYSRGNPLEDLNVLVNPDAVVKRGRWFDASQLTERRNMAIENRSFWGELGTLIEAY